MLIDRAMTLLDDGDDTVGHGLAFERIFVILLVTEYWARALAFWDTLDSESSVYLALASILCVLAWRTSIRRPAFAGLALVQLLVLRHEFPQAGNHAYLELVFCLLLAALDPRNTGERQVLLRSVRWVAIVVLFWSGVQKLTHGYYFHGEQLAYSLRIESFRPVLGLLLPANEVARLGAYSGGVGDGPYFVPSLVFVGVSNAVYATEIALAVLLFIPRTRKPAAAGAILFLFAVESAAREVFFGLMFLNAILSFLDTEVHRRSLGVFAAVSACLLLVRLGILPAVVFY